MATQDTSAQSTSAQAASSPATLRSPSDDAQQAEVPVFRAPSFETFPAYVESEHFTTSGPYQDMSLPGGPSKRPWVQEPSRASTPDGIGEYTKFLNDLREAKLGEQPGTKVPGQRSSSPSEPPPAKRPRPAQELPPQELPAQESPAQESPAQELPAQESPAQESPAQESPAQELPAQESPAQEPPAEELPAQELPAQKSPAQEPPAQKSPAQEPPAQKSPAQEPPAQESPAQEPPAQEPPAQELPAQKSPAQESPAEELPAQESPAQELPLAPPLLGFRSHNAPIANLEGQFIAEVPRQESSPSRESLLAQELIPPTPGTPILSASEHSAVMGFLDSFITDNSGGQSRTEEPSQVLSSSREPLRPLLTDLLGMVRTLRDSPTPDSSRHDVAEELPARESSVQELPSRVSPPPAGEPIIEEPPAAELAPNQGSPPDQGPPPGYDPFDGDALAGPMLGRIARHIYAVRRYDTPTSFVKGLKRCDGIYVNALLFKTLPGMRSAILLARVPAQPESLVPELDLSGRDILEEPYADRVLRLQQIETPGDWHLPGVECLGVDSSILQRLASHILFTTGLMITRFKSKFAEEVITVTNRYGEEKRIYVVTFEALWDSERELHRNPRRWAQLSWKTYLDIDEDFTMRSGALREKIVRKLRGNQWFRECLVPPVIPPPVRP